MSRVPSGFVDMCVELLGEAVGRVSAKAMFSGWGLFRDGRMFGLIVEDRLYLKTDAANRPRFEAAGLEPFTYLAKSKKRVSLGYYEVPPEALDDAAEMRLWARGAIDAAMRMPEKKSKAAPKRIADLASLGPKSQTWLGEAGIVSIDDLKRAGAVGAYIAVKRRRQREATRNLLYGLYAALKGLHWTKVPAAEKRRLDADVEAALKPPKSQRKSAASKR